MPRPERPLDQTSTDPVVRFACDLRKLRRRAGNPSYRTLARSAGFSVTTLAEAAAGRNLPTLAVTCAYARACGGDIAEWESRWHDLAAVVAHPAQTAQPDTAGAEGGVDGTGGAASPYVGLGVFQAQDADRFFGREDLTADLADRVDRGSFVAVFGASGSGKSSLLRAGLAARWSASGRRCVVITPGPCPLTSYRAALTRLAGSHEPDGDDLLVIDQFEEVFTLCSDHHERDQFIADLVTAVQGPARRVRVVVGVRSDFYDRCARDRELAVAMRDSQFLVGPMTTQQLRAAITRPALLAGATVESALLAALVADCAGEAGVLPMLSHALRETWTRRRGMTMTLAGYQAAGGIAHAIARTAETTYQRCDEPQQARMKALFLRLTALGEGTEDTKRRIPQAELDRDDPDTQAVLDRLTRARLVTVDGEHVDIAHEALIRCWPRLRGWLAEDREGLRIHHQLTTAAALWESLGRDPDALYRGVRLEDTERWATDERVLTGRERAFLDASLAELARSQALTQRRTRRLRSLVALLSVLVVVAGVLAIVALNEQRSALQQRDFADAQRVLTQATALTATDPGTAGQLALAAYRLSPTQQTASGVLNTLAASHMRQTTVPGTVLAMSQDGRVLVLLMPTREVQLWTLTTGHASAAGDLVRLGTQERVAPPVFSADNRLLLLNISDTSVQLWDIADPGRPTLLHELPGIDPNVLQFAGDHTAMVDNQIWDITDPRHPTLLDTLPTTAASGQGALSQDGRTFVAIPANKTMTLSVQLWDLSQPHHPRLAAVEGRPGFYRQPVLQGQQLAVLEDDLRTVQVWNIANVDHPRLVTTIASRSPGILYVAFSSDGNELAATTARGMVIVWDIDMPEVSGRTVRAPALADEINDLRFGSDDQLITAHGGGPSLDPFYAPGLGLLGNAGAPDTVQWWDLPPAALSLGSRLAGYGPTYSPDGRTLATAGQTAAGAPVTNLWDLSQPRSPYPEGFLNSATGTKTATSQLQPSSQPGMSAVSFNGRRHLMATSSRSIIRLWDARDIRHPRPVTTTRSDDGFPEAGLLIDPNGRYLFDSGSIWDIRDIRHPKQLNSSTHEMEAGAFSADGGTFAGFNDDSTGVSLYDIGHRGKQVLLGKLPIDDIPAGMMLSPHGDVLVMAYLTAPVQLWNVKDRRLLATVPHSAGLAALSPDGRTLAVSNGSDNTIRLLNITNPRLPTPTAILTGLLDPLTFSPDGHTLAAVGTDGALQLRETNLQRAITDLCSTTAPLSRATWRQYLPGHSYQAPC